MVPVCLNWCIRQIGYMNNLIGIADLHLRVNKLGYFYCSGPLDLLLAFREVVVSFLHLID